MSAVGNARCLEISTRGQVPGQKSGARVPMQRQLQVKLPSEWTRAGSGEESLLCAGRSEDEPTLLDVSLSRPFQRVAEAFSGAGNRLDAISTYTRPD